MKFRDLCGISLTEQYFYTCLIMILEELCYIMYNHYQMIQWHEEYNNK